MKFRFVTAAVALTAVAGCVSYTGGARSFDPAALTSERGWVRAAPTPVVHQTGSHDCGPAALAMIAGRWRAQLSVEAALDALPPVTPQGTRLGDLRDAARAQGLTAFAITGDRRTLAYELRKGRPVIVGLLLPDASGRPRSHFEVVVAVRPADGQFATIDPASGWLVRSWKTFDSEWAPAGRPMLVVLGPEGR